MVDEGGCAFPLHGIDGVIDYGMSLRDYFAAQTIVAMGTWTPSYTASLGGVINQQEVMRARAEFAYAQSDAMLKVRAAAPESPQGSTEA